MTNFSVKPDALDAYAEVLDSLKVDKGLKRKYLLDYSSYMDKWVELGQGEGGVIFMSIVGKTHDIHEQLVGQNAAIDTCLFESRRKRHLCKCRNDGSSLIGRVP